MDRSRRWHLVAVVVSAACFGTLAVLTPLAYETGVRPLPLLAWRFVTAALLLAVVAQVREPGSLKVSIGDVGRFSLLALTGYGAASVCFFFALVYADAAVVAVLLYAYPAFVTLAGWLILGDKLTFARAGAVLATFIGCALVVGLGSDKVNAQLPGVLLGLGAALGYTLFNLLSHRWLPGRSRLTMMAYTFGIAAALPTVGSVVLDGPAALSPAGWTLGTWGLLAAIVVVPTFAAVVLYLEGIRGLGPAQAAVISTLEPIFTIALARLFLPRQATLSGLQLVGVALVIGGVLVAEMGARAASEPATV